MTSHVKLNPFEQASLLQEPCVNGCESDIKCWQNSSFAKILNFCTWLIYLKKFCHWSFQYDSIFCSSNLELYINVMIRLAIIFHYLAVTSLWQIYMYNLYFIDVTAVSGLCHQKINFPAYYNFKERWLSIIIEKKVEIWHSLLRNHISSHYSGNEIHDTATSLAASDTARKFHSSFVRPYTRGQSEKKHETYGR